MTTKQPPKTISTHKVIRITQQQISKWQKEKAQLEARLADDKQRLSILLRRLDALALYEGE